MLGDEEDENWAASELGQMEGLSSGDAGGSNRSEKMRSSSDAYNWDGGRGAHERKSRDDPREEGWCMIADIEGGLILRSGCG